jgi:hypothetical protein
MFDSLAKPDKYLASLKEADSMTQSRQFNLDAAKGLTHCCPTSASSQHVFSWDPVSFPRTKTLDACVTSGFLPFALRAALRAFKSDPFGFVAGMTCIIRFRSLCSMVHSLRHGDSSLFREKPQKNALFIGPITRMHRLNGTALGLTPSINI